MMVGLGQERFDPAAWYEPGEGTPGVSTDVTSWWERIMTGAALPTNIPSPTLTLALAESGTESGTEPVSTASEQRLFGISANSILTLGIGVLVVGVVLSAVRN